MHTSYESYSAALSYCLVNCEQQFNICCCYKHQHIQYWNYECTYICVSALGVWITLQFLYVREVIWKFLFKVLRQPFLEGVVLSLPLCDLWCSKADSGSNGDSTQSLSGSHRSQVQWAGIYRQCTGTSTVFTFSSSGSLIAIIQVIFLWNLFL